MSSKVDIQKSARLVAEAAILTRLIMHKYTVAICVDTVDSKEARVYKKSRQGLVRRASAYDAIAESDYIHIENIIARECAWKSPLVDIFDMFTRDGNIIRFDIYCPAGCEH